MTFLTKKHVSFHRIVAKSNRFPIILPFKIYMSIRLLSFVI